MTESEIKKVEDIVNEKILSGLNIDISEKSIDEARKMGAMALFGEKYGDVVRVVNMGNYSIELCGGAHLKNTAQVGSFKIVSENGVASGVRRIEALTGEGALKHYQSEETALKEICAMLKTNPDNMVKRLGDIIKEQKDLAKEVEKLKAEMASGAADEILKNCQEVNGINVVCAQVENTSADDLKTMGDELKNRLGEAVVVLASSVDGKVSLVAMATKGAVDKGVHAGKIIKEAAAVCGGGGGGKPAMAQAGGKDASKIGDALKKAEEVIKSQL